MCKTIAMLLSDTSIAVVVQALDAVFSIFGNEINNDLFVSLGILGILRTVEPRIKSKAEVIITCF